MCTNTWASDEWRTSSTLPWASHTNPFWLFACTAAWSWAGEVSHVHSFQKSSMKAHTWAAQSSNQLMAQEHGHMLSLKHVNHLFHSWHPQHHLGSPEASCCTWDPPDKGAVINLSETTVFHTQENTVDELFITMLPTSSTTAEPNT